MGRWAVAAGAVVGLGLMATGAMAQDAPPPTDEPLQTEALTSPATAAGGPQWRVFSESDAMLYLADMSSVVTDGENSSVTIARVRKTKPAGDFSHTVDAFAVRCEANETRAVTSTEVFEDGVESETYDTDEPWTPVEPRTFDHAVRDIACGVMEPGRDPFPSVKAYIEAGRP